MNAESTEMTPEELAEYTTWLPLEEYCNKWGLAYKADEAIQQSLTADVMRE